MGETKGWDTLHSLDSATEPTDTDCDPTQLFTTLSGNGRQEYQGAF